MNQSQWHNWGGIPSTYDKKAYTYYVPERDAASSEWVRRSLPHSDPRRQVRSRVSKLEKSDAEVLKEKASVIARRSSGKRKKRLPCRNWMLTTTDGERTINVTNTAPSPTTGNYGVQPASLSVVAANGILERHRCDGDTLRPFWRPGLRGDADLIAMAHSRTRPIRLYRHDRFAYKADDGVAQSNIAIVTLNVHSPTTRRRPMAIPTPRLTTPRWS